MYSDYFMCIFSPIYLVKQRIEPMIGQWKEKIDLEILESGRREVEV